VLPRIRPGSATFPPSTGLPHGLAGGACSFAHFVTRLASALLAGCLAPGATAAQAAGPVVVAVVSDGPAARDTLAVETLLRESAVVLDGDPQLSIPQRLRRDGGWSVAGVDAALDAVLADPDVDVVVTSGPIGSSLAARRDRLARPVIAAAAVEPIVQGFPVESGHSGRRNFTYVADFGAWRSAIEALVDMTGARHIAAVLDEQLLVAVPELAAGAAAVGQALGVGITLVPAGTSAAAVLARLPTDTDAVLVTTLPRLSGTEMTNLASSLRQRRLPTMATSRSDVEAGLLLANAAEQRDSDLLARRIALDIQRLHAGEAAADLEVALVVPRRLLINMETAGAIGFSPAWRFLADAEQLHDASSERVPALSLAGAMQLAAERNPTLQASRQSAAMAAQDVRIARANLLPHTDLSASATRIDADHANPLTRAEKSASGELSFTQIIYADDAWAAHTISRQLAAAADAAARAALLDTLQSTANAYLELLSAQAVEQVRRANVELTRRNLETARVREQVGLSDHSDYLRWIAQLARDRSHLLDAESRSRLAATELNRLLHLADGETFRAVDPALEDPRAFVGDSRLRDFMDTPARWESFGRFALTLARRQSPEIVQAEARVSAQERVSTNASRALYLPDFALVSRRDDGFWRAGAGSSGLAGAPGDKSWSVTLQATIPLFDGGARRADLSRARHELQLARARLEATVDGVDARVRAAIQRVAASYPSIELADTAAGAAGENLAMVADAYARGIVSVTDLIDAQEAALAAQLSVSQGRYGFLMDFIDVLRSTGDFAPLLDPAARNAWYREVEQWFDPVGTSQPALQVQEQ
jgi:outer membrane protein